MHVLSERSGASLIARVRGNDLVIHGAIVFGGLIVANVFNYLYYMLAGRVLGVEPYGELTSLTSAVLALAAPANVAQIVVARLAAEFEAEGNGPALRHLARVTTVWTSLAAVLAIALGVVFREALTAFFHISSALPVLAASVGLAGYALITVQRGILQGTHRFGELSASYCVEAIVRVAAGIPLAITLGAFGGLLGLVAGVAVCFGYNLWTLHVALRGTEGAFSPDVRQVAAVASRVGAAQLMLFVLAFYDVALVRHFDAVGAGLYAAAALVGRAVGGVLAFVPTLIMPKTTARASTGASAAPILGAALGVGAAIVAVAGLAALLAPRTLAVMFAGRAFGEAAPLVLPYVLAAGMLGLASIVAAYQIGLHRYRFVVPSTLVAVAEIGAIAVWHPTLASVVMVLLCGHAAFFAATFVGIAARRRA